MAILCRPMRRTDVAPCVEIVAQHPVIGSRYAQTIADLPVVWSSLLGREAFRAYVYEDAQDSPPRLVGKARRPSRTWTAWTSRMRSSGRSSNCTVVFT